MSGSPDVGLILGLGIDPSGVKPGLDQSERELAEYEHALDEATREVNAGFEETDKRLIGTRESVRLLSEEFGLRLPRAVTGAVAQALPEIASMGGALLGMFALEQAYKWGKVVNEQFFQIYTEGDQTIKNLDAAAAAAFKHAGEEATEMLTHFRTSLAGAFDIAQIDAHAAQLQRFHDAYKSLVGKTVDEVRTAMATVSGLAATVTEATAQGLTSLEDVDNKITEIGQLQFDAHKQMAEVQAKEDKQRADEAKRQAAEAKREAEEADRAAAKAAAEAARRAMQEEEMIVRLTELADRSTKRMQKWHEEWLKEIGMPEEVKFSLQEINREINQQGLAAADALPKLTALGGGVEKLSEAQREALPTEEQIKRVRQELVKLYPDMTAAEQKQTAEHLAAVPAIKAHVDELGKLKGSHQALDAEIKKGLATHAAERTALTLSTAAHKAYGDVVKATKVVMEEFADAAEKDIAAVQADYAGSVEALAAGMANQIGGERAVAAVKVVSETARGLECLAEGTWPPNPAAIIAAGIHFDSAAEWAKLAGTSAARHGAGAGGVGAGGGGYRDEGYGERGYGAGGGGNYDRERIADTGLAPGAVGSNSGRLSIYVFGEDEQARMVAGWVNSAHRQGMYMRVAAAEKSAPAQG